MYHVATPPEEYPEEFAVASQCSEEWWSACMVKHVGDYEDFVIYDQEDEISEPEEDDLFNWYACEKGETETLKVCTVAETSNRPELIVLDSGADVSLLPRQLQTRGRPSSQVNAILEDAQGNRLENYGRRIAQVHFYNDVDLAAVVEDDFMVASVRSPLLSMGRLMQKGWTVVEMAESETGIGLCAPDRQVVIPIYYKKSSLAIYGCVRRVSSEGDLEPLSVCTVVKVNENVFEEVKRSKRGWTRSAVGFGRPFCITTNMDKFINPTYNYDFRYWPMRTTLVQLEKNENRWEVIEFCEEYAKKENAYETIDGVSTSDVVMTILHNRQEELESLGEVLSSDGFERNASPKEMAEFEFKLEPGIPKEIQEQILPEEHEQIDHGGGAEDIVWHFEPRETLNVDGNEISEHSSLRTLRSAAEYLGVSKGGSRRNLWQRLNDKAIMLEREAAFEIANKLYKEEHLTVAHPPLPRCPSESEKAEHEMTHLPYRSWCEFCVACKAKSDSQKVVMEEPGGRRSIPSIQMDFCFGKEKPKDPLNTKLVALDCWTKMILAVPLESKGSAIRHTAEQVVKFSLNIGYFETVEFIGDSEPTMKALLEMVRQIRQGMGYGVVVTYGKPYEKGRTAQVERWIQTLRRQASTLVHHAEQKCLVKLEPQHPLVAWSYLHAAWLLNRFHQCGQCTAFEAAFGRKYNGKITTFGEFVQVYNRPLNCKQGPLWVPGIWVGKTSDGNEDMHIVLSPGGVVKGKAIRRNAEPWRGTWLFLARHKPFKVVKSRELQFSASTPTMPKIVEDRDAEDVRKHALEHGESEDEQQPEVPTEVQQHAGELQQEEPQREQTTMKRPPTASIEELEMQSQLEQIGDQVPQTPEMLTEMVDDSAIEESSAQRRRIESPTTSPTSRLFPPAFAGNIQQAGEVDEENWEDDMLGDFEENEMDYNMFLEDMLKNEGKPPQLEPEELEAIEQAAGFSEVERLFDMGVIVEPTQEDLEQGSFLTTKEVFDWRWRDSMWTRRCRLVAREFKGGERGDNTTFAPMSHVSANRLILALHLCFKWLLAFVDVRNAFLLVPQRERVLIQVPAWYRRDEKNWGVINNGMRVWALRRCLPGQRNAGARWFEYLSEILGEIGFESLGVLPAMFRHKTRDLALCGHVDDLVISGREMEIDWCLGQLREKFEISESGVFPGLHQDPMEPVRFLKKRHFFCSQGIIVMPHEKYVKSLISMYGLESRRPKPTPEGTNGLLDSENELEGERRKLFRSGLGTLLYVAQDRVDIQHSVRNLAQAMARPTAEAERGLKHLILYLKGTENHGILLPYQQQFGSKIEEIQGERTEDAGNRCSLVEVFSDADWAGDQSSAAKRRHSVSSVMVFVNNCLIQSYSRSQKSIALSSCESEFLALTGATAEAMHVKKIWQFLTRGDVEMVAFTDSSSCLALSQRLGVGRAKHLDVRQLWIQNEVKKGEVQVRKIPTELNLADLNTKRLSKSRREFLLYLIGAVDKADSGEETQKVGQQEFERFLERKAVSESLKHVRKVVLKDLLNGTLGRNGGGASVLATLAMLNLPRASGESAEQAQIDYEMHGMRETFATEFWWLLFFTYTGVMVAFGFLLREHGRYMVNKLYNMLEMAKYYFMYYVRGEIILVRDFHQEDLMAEEFRGMREQELAGNPLQPNIVDYDPFHGRVRRIRILDREEDADSNESYFERQDVTNRYVKRVKGAQRSESETTQPQAMEVDEDGEEEEQCDDGEADLIYIPDEYGKSIGKPKYLAGKRWTEFFAKDYPTWPRRLVPGDGRHINSDTPMTAPLRGENYNDVNRLLLYLSRPEERRARALRKSGIFYDKLMVQFLQMRLQNVHNGHPMFVWDHVLWWDNYDKRAFGFFSEMLSGNHDDNWDMTIEGYLLSDPDNAPEAD